MAGEEIDLQFWREAYKQLAWSKMRSRRIASQGELAEQLECEKSELTRHIGRDATPTRGALHGKLNLLINAKLGIEDSDLAQLPGGSTPGSPFFVQLYKREFTEAHQAEILAQTTQQTLAQLAPDVSAETVLDLARTGRLRLDNSLIPGGDLREMAQAAADEGRDDDALKLLDAHDVLIAETRREENRVEFPMKVMRAGLFVRANKYYEAIEAFGVALQLSDGVADDDLATAELTRRKLIHFKASRKEDYVGAHDILTREYAPPFDWDVYSHSILIAKAERFDDAKAMLGEMKDAGIAPNVISYNSLIAKAERFDDAKAMLGEMKDAGIAPDVISYNSLIAKAERFDDAKAMLGEMKDAGIAPNVISYSALIAKAERFDDAKAMLGEMKDAGIAPNVISYSALIAKAERFDDAKALLGEMKDAGISPDVISYNSLVAKAERFDDAKALLGEMKDAGIAPNVISYSALIAKAERFDDAKALLGEMKDAGIAPNVISYSALIAKAERFDDAKAMLGEMKDAGIAPNVISYSALIAKAERFDDAKALLGEMKDAGIAPNIISYTSAIALAPSEAQAARIYHEMTNRGLKPDLKVFTTLIDLSRAFGTAYGYFRDMVRAGVAPDSFVMQVMVRKADEYKAARDLLGVMRTKLNMRPDLIAYAKGVRLAKNPSQARDLVVWMWEDRVQVDYRFLKLLEQRGMWDEIDRFEELGLIKRA